MSCELAVGAKQKKLPIKKVEITKTEWLLFSFSFFGIFFDEKEIS